MVYTIAMICSVHDKRASHNLNACTKQYDRVAQICVLLVKTKVMPLRPREKPDRFDQREGN